MCVPARLSPPSLHRHQRAPLPFSPPCGYRSPENGRQGQTECFALNWQSECDSTAGSQAALLLLRERRVGNDQPVAMSCIRRAPKGTVLAPICTKTAAKCQAMYQFCRKSQGLPFTQLHICRPKCLPGGGDSGARGVGGAGSEAVGDSVICNCVSFPKGIPSQSDRIAKFLFGSRQRLEFGHLHPTRAGYETSTR